MTPSHLKTSAISIESLEGRTLLASAAAPFNVTLGPAKVVNEGQAIHFKLHSVTGGEVKRVRWDFDGIAGYEKVGATRDHTYLDNRGTPYKVRVLVTAMDDQTVRKTLLVTVKNVAPTMALTLPPSFVSFYPMPCTIRIDDPGQADALTVDIDWGDGQHDSAINETEPGTLKTEHIFATRGKFTIHATVHDKDSASTSASAPMEIGVVVEMKNTARNRSLGIANQIFIGGTAGRDRLDIFDEPKEDDSPKTTVVQIASGGNTTQVLLDLLPINVRLGPGNDKASIHSVVSNQVKVYGDAGNDVFDDQSTQSTTFIGGSGADQADGGSEDHLQP